MSSPLVSDDLREAIEPLLPREPPKPKAGRPRIPDRTALGGSIFILRTGAPWRWLPRALGCGSGSTCWRRRRDWHAAGVWKRLHAALLNWLGDEAKIDGSRGSVESISVRAKRGGADTGPNPVDRAKCGSKYHLVVDRQGIPLAVRLSDASESMGLGHTTPWLHRGRSRHILWEQAMPDHPPAFQQHIQAELDRLAAGGLPGGFVYVEDADGAVTFRTAGVADLASGTRMTPERHYRIGSTTKTFTAVVVLQLVAEGRLALGDRVQDRLPDLPIPNGDRLTVEHLLRMRSGLLDFEDHPSLLGNLDAHLQPVRLARVIELALGGPPSFAPGARFAYCNSNFCLLEVVVEQVTGRSLGAELRERVFDPVGLTRTSYPHEDDLALPEPYIRGYDRTGDTWRECSRAFFGRGDGAIISTAADTARFLRALLVERTLVAPPLLAEMLAIVPDDPPARFAYGLGLIAHPTACGPVWGHSGDGFGYAHAPFVRIETGRVAIIMRNASFGYGPLRNEALGQQLSFTPEFRSSLYC